MSEQGRTDWSTKPMRRRMFSYSFGSWLPGLALIVVFAGPIGVHRLLEWIGGSTQSRTLGKTILTLITAASGVVAARTSRESKTAPEKVPVWRKVAFALAAPTFVFLLLVGVSSANLAQLEWLDTLGILPEYTHPPGGGLPEIAFLLAMFTLVGLLMGLVIAGLLLALYMPLFQLSSVLAG